MFIEFLINVAITASGFLPLLLLMVLIGLFLTPIAKSVAYLLDDPELKDHITQKRSLVFKSVGVAFLLVLCFSATQPSNTYKHENFDRNADKQRIQLLQERNNSRILPEVRDRTRQPDLTREERKVIFEDMVDRSRFTIEEENQ